jgi:plasmid stability protein
VEDLIVDLDGTTIQSLLLRSYHNGRSFNDEILAILREAVGKDPVARGGGEHQADLIEDE